MESKPCSHCREIKSLDQFHRAARGRLGRASWCKTCANSIYRENRGRTYSPEQKRRWQIKTRYGLTVEQLDAMKREQNGQCGICSETPEKLYVDHNHLTNKVRGLLCHRCNLLIGGLDDPDRRQRALLWLERN